MGNRKLVDTVVDRAAERVYTMLTQGDRERRPSLDDAIAFVKTFPAFDGAAEAEISDRVQSKLEARDVMEQGKLVQSGVEEESEALRPGQRMVFKSTDTDGVRNVEIEIVRPLTTEEADLHDVGPMYKIRLQDGSEQDAFVDELSPLPEQRKVVENSVNVSKATEVICIALENDDAAVFVNGQVVYSLESTDEGQTAPDIAFALAQALEVKLQHEVMPVPKDDDWNWDDVYELLPPDDAQQTEVVEKPERKVINALTDEQHARIFGCYLARLNLEATKKIFASIEETWHASLHYGLSGQLESQTKLDAIIAKVIAEMGSNDKANISGIMERALSGNLPSPDMAPPDKDDSPSPCM